MRRITSAVAVLALTLTLVACSGGTEDADTAATTASPPATTASEPPTTAVEVPNVVGLPLDEARDALKAAGITEITETDIRDGKSIWEASNWVVVEQGGDATGVTLGVEKPQVEKPQEEAAASADGPEASARFEQALKDALGVQSFSELLVVDASMWGGYINGVRVEDGLAHITLQIADDDPGRDELGSRAASAISTLLPATAVEGITWIIVEDALGVVIAQEQPAPIT